MSGERPSFPFIVQIRFPRSGWDSGGYLVVAADPAVFAAKYPAVTGVVGGWLGILSNSRNKVDLEDAAGQQIDTVTYSDEGDWASRQRGPLANSHYGWIWFKEHDGLGKSLELVNPALPNEYGQNWASSIVDQRTPGQPNSVLSGNIAPLILEVGHVPIIPTSSDQVTVNCRILDEHSRRPERTVVLARRQRVAPGLYRVDHAGQWAKRGWGGQ